MLHNLMWMPIFRLHSLTTSKTDVLLKYAKQDNLLTNILGPSMKNANIIFHRITLMDSYSTDYYDISYPGLIMKVLLAKYFQHLRKLFLPNYSSSTWPASLPTTWCRRTSPPPSSSSLPGSRFSSPLSPCLEGYYMISANIYHYWCSLCFRWGWVWQPC